MIQKVGNKTIVAFPASFIWEKLTFEFGNVLKLFGDFVSQSLKAFL